MSTARARIVYRRFLNRNDIGNIEGIAFGLINGMTALVFPKYSKEILSGGRRIPGWEFRSQREFEAMKRGNNGETKDLCAMESPAALHAAQFHSDRFGTFGLPTLLAALEIDARKDEIDCLAKSIVGADLLRDFPAGIWSCSLSDASNGWRATNGYAGISPIYKTLTAIPTLLFDSSTKLGRL